MRFVYLLLPLAAGLSAAPAGAQAIGGRAELRVGYDEPRINLFAGDEAEELGGGSLSIGGEVGADATVAGSVVLGAYGGVDFSGSDACKGELFFADDEACFDAGRNYYAGLRAGLLTGDTGLVYVKGGYSNGKFRGSYDDGVDVVFSDSDSVGGWHVGAGLELELSGPVYLKGEYVHTKYDRDAFGSDLPDGNSARLTRHQIMGGVGIRFGGARK